MISPICPNSPVHTPDTSASSDEPVTPRKAGSRLGVLGLLVLLLLLPVGISGCSDITAPPLPEADIEEPDDEDPEDDG